MSRPFKPFTTPKRSDCKTFQISLNPRCGLPERVCREWKRRSFQDLPQELAQYRYPKTKSAAEAGVFALIEFLKKATEPVHISTDRITVKDWMEKFTRIEGNPRGARNLAENRPYSVNTIKRYECLYRLYLKDDPFCKLHMSEVEESDALEFISRMARSGMKRKDYQEKTLIGSDTFEKTVKFLRMAFKEYQQTHPHWHNAFQSIRPPRVKNTIPRDALSEEEVISLFAPGVLTDTMDLGICAAMFLSGLRRGEIYALKPEDLDWHTPKIIVRRAWQNYDSMKRELGPTKGKKERIAPFPAIPCG